MIKTTGPSSRGSSYYGKWRECPRKWAYTHRPDLQKLAVPDAAPGSMFAGMTEGGHAPRKAAAPSLGTFVHELLRVYYQGLLGAPREPLGPLARALANDLGIDTEDRDLGVQRTRQYISQWSGADLTPLAVEVELQMGLLPERDAEGHLRVRSVEYGTPGSIPYTGRIDLVAIDRQGRVWFIDHKTCAEYKKSEAFTYGMSLQIHGHHMLGKHAYPGRFAGPLLNFIQTRTGPRFVREPPVGAPKMIEDAPLRIVWTAWEIDNYAQRATRIEDYPGTASPNMCSTRWGPCEFQRQCRFHTAA